MAINNDKLEFALEFVSSGYEFDHSAYLDKESGKIYFDSDTSEDELPEDLFENDKYVQIPDKREFGLGKPLAIEYSQINLPGELELVYSFFRSRGAYSNFKALLDNKKSTRAMVCFRTSSIKKSNSRMVCCK